MKMKKLIIYKLSECIKDGKLLRKNICEEINLPALDGNQTKCNYICDCFSDRAKADEDTWGDDVEFFENIDKLVINGIKLFNNGGITREGHELIVCYDTISIDEIFDMYIYFKDDSYVHIAFAGCVDCYNSDRIIVYDKNPFGDNIYNAKLMRKLIKDELSSLSYDKLEEITKIINEE